MTKYAYVLRNCQEDGISHDGFVWPKSGLVEAPDWNPEPVCGGGLHGWLDAMGDMSLGFGHGAPVWIVVKVLRDEVVELQGKVKFPRGEVVFYGDVDGAVAYLASVGVCGYRGTATAGVSGTATAGDGGTATAGDGGTATVGICGTATAGDDGTATAGVRGKATAGNYGTATAGYRGTATAGLRGTATAGYRGTATAGYRGTATAGVRGTATAGDYGTLILKWWDSRRYRTAVGYVGENGIEPNVAYRLDDKGKFVKADL